MSKCRERCAHDHRCDRHPRRRHGLHLMHYAATLDELHVWRDATDECMVIPAMLPISDTRAE